MSSRSETCGPTPPRAPIAPRTWTCFSKPTRLKEITYYDIAGPGPQGSDNWSAYPYTGPLFRKGGGVPVYASDGVHTPDSAQGMVVFRTKIPRPGKKGLVDHLNPQTMD